MDDTQLIEMAFAAKKRAYAPYSGFRVGAALLAKDGRAFSGCNVEGASYGNTICAERCALVKAVSEGAREFEAIAVCADTEDFCTPCGICRQMLYEFSPEMTVLCANRRGEFRKVRLSELLPCGFGKSSMEKGEKR